MDLIKSEINLIKNSLTAIDQETRNRKETCHEAFLRKMYWDRLKGLYHALDRNIIDNSIEYDPQMKKYMDYVEGELMDLQVKYKSLVDRFEDQVEDEPTFKDQLIGLRKYIEDEFINIETRFHLLENIEKTPSYIEGKTVGEDDFPEENTKLKKYIGGVYKNINNLSKRISVLEKELKERDFVGVPPIEWDSHTPSKTGTDGGSEPIDTMVESGVNNSEENLYEHSNDDGECVKDLREQGEYMSSDKVFGFGPKLNDPPKVFLGGTCNGSKWRELMELHLIHYGIGYFNPVVDDWTEEAQKREIEERENCDFCLYTITPEMKGVYSIAEIIDDSNKRPDKAILILLKKFGGQKFDESMWKSLMAVNTMVLNNGGFTFFDIESAAEFINTQIELRKQSK